MIFMPNTVVNQEYVDSQKAERDRRLALDLEVVSYHEYGKTIWDCQTEFRFWFNHVFGETPINQGTLKLYYNGGKSWKANNHAGNIRIDTNSHHWLVETKEQQLLATLYWSRR